MKIKRKKWFFIVLFLFVLLITKNIVKANDEILLINDEEVKFFKTNESVMIPSTDEYKLVQMRGMWVATVWNGDFNRVYSVENFKKQYLEIITNLENNNFNTIFFQIRPNNDAFYQSTLNPWSQWMTGSQGKALKENDEIFDPLKWMIEVTHERGMQFYGWLNAYRVTHNALFSDSSNNYNEETVRSAVLNRLNSLDNLNFAKKNKQYIVLGDNDSKIILNPGEPVIQNFVVNTVKEIVEKYDIDGVHFDDYFYLDSSNSSKAEVVVNNFEEYKEADTAFNNYFNDYNTYMNYRTMDETLANFRRRSVNKMIERISIMIKEVNAQKNSSIKFGSKPAAVWTSSSRNVPNRIKGANVEAYSYSSYFDIYADSLYWVEQGWVDWISPQIYFNFTNREVPYADIVKWWSMAIEQANEKLIELGKNPVRLYIAHGVYRMAASSENPVNKRITDDMEVLYQLRYNQMFNNISGSAFYDYSTYFSNTTLVKNTRNNVLTRWDKKSIPMINDVCSIMPISKIDKVNKVINIINNDEILSYIIYKCNTIEEINDSTVYKVVYKNDELNIPIDDVNAKYFIKCIDNKYNLSSDIFVLNDDNYSYNEISLYNNEEYKLTNMQGDFTVDKENIVNVKIENNDFIIHANEVGNCLLTIKNNEKTYIYNIIIKKINTITYLLNDGIITDTYKTTYKEEEEYHFPIPVKEKYIFKGYYINDELVTSTAGLNGDITVEAKWEMIPSYTISSINKTGYMIEIDNNIKEVLSGESITFKIVLEEGYNKDNIEVKINNSIILEENGIYSINNINENIMIEVDGVSINTYKVTFIYDDTAIESYVNYGDDALPPIEKVKRGYTFIGYDKEYKDIKSETVINAIYEINEYTISFVCNCEYKISNVHVLYNEDIPILSIPEYAGYNFLGWYINPELTEKMDISKMPDKDLTLYAMWEQIIEPVEESNCLSGFKIISILNCSLIAFTVYFLRKIKRFEI